MARRDMGKLVFLDLVDRSGRIQLICPASGRRARRPPRRRRGRDRLACPIAPRRAFAPGGRPRGAGADPRRSRDTFHGIEDVELRYRKRYLDLLMSEDSRREAILRARMVSAIRGYLDGEGFLEVETPIPAAAATAAASPSRS
jgi:lysyl-tRNA synthetase class II